MGPKIGVKNWVVNNNNFIVSLFCHVLLFFHFFLPNVISELQNFFVRIIDNINIVRGTISIEILLKNTNILLIYHCIFNVVLFLSSSIFWSIEYLQIMKKQVPWKTGVLSELLNMMCFLCVILIFLIISTISTLRYELLQKGVDIELFMFI